MLALLTCVRVRNRPYIRPMAKRTLFHGANGDTILSIIADGAMRPDVDGVVYFGSGNYADCFMHGGDKKRKATFVIEVDVDIVPTARALTVSTKGVAQTLKVFTSVPLPCTVRRLAIREPRATAVVWIQGSDAVAKYLQARQT
jgi:hypothetical protein